MGAGVLVGTAVLVGAAVLVGTAVAVGSASPLLQAVKNKPNKNKRINNNATLDFI